MNLLRTIIERLNQRIEVANIFDKQFNLCELNANGNDKAWVHYIGNGQAEVVTNFDAKNGTLFWAKRSKVTVNKTDAYKMSGCKQLYVTSFPLTAYAIVKKSHLPCDSEDAQDWLASRIYKLASGTDPLFKQSIGVINYEVVPTGYINEIKTLTANYEWACVSVDMDVQVITSSEDGCYDTCATGDIPLPDLQPCTPCLTEVAVDGVTITGNGTPADPLVAIGGGGGTPLITQDEGSNVSTNTTTLNFTGEGVTASLISAGVVEVNIPSGSGAVGTLQEVTDLGNSTTNDIDFIANAGLTFDNGALFRKGTTDAGNGGAKGTAQICSISYELKWEAGRLYYMEQDGFTIRDVTHNFTFVPQPTDDSTKGFIVGSRWSLDDGTVYVCSDATIGAAVWAVVSTGGVTSVTATSPIFSSGGATPDISIQPANLFDDGYLTSADFTSFSNKFDVPTGTSGDYLDGTGTPTLFPTIPAAQVNSDWSATSGVAEILNKPTLTNGTVTSVDLSMPAAFSVSGNPITTSGTLAVAAAGVATQYIRGDGQLANFPSSSGGGASVSYYLNGSISQGTFGGVAMREMNKTPIIGAGTDFSINANGYIQSFITDANDPNQLAIPAGNWNFEMYFSASSSGGSPSFYLELYKWNGTTLTLIATSSANPESITNGTAIDLYTTALAIPSTVLAATDRLAVRVYVTHSGRTITLHTEDSHLCQVLTTFSTGLTSLNGLTEQTQLLAVGTSGTDFAISSTTATHTFNLPTASAFNRGALSSADWTTFNSKGSGTVTTVSGTAPIASSGGATPAISIADAAADGSTKGAAAFTAADFNAAAGVISIDYTNGQAASASNKGFLTSADWTTFNNKTGSIYKDLNNQAAVVGTTANTKVVSQLVPANTFAVGDIIEIKCRFGKTISTGLTTLRMYINTADSLTVPAATLIATSITSAGANNYLGTERQVLIKSATVTQSINAASSLFSDLGNFNGVQTNSNIDWTVNQYIIFAIQNAVITDSTVISYFQIIKQ